MNKSEDSTEKEDEIETLEMPWIEEKRKVGLCIHSSVLSLIHSG